MSFMDVRTQGRVCIWPGGLKSIIHGYFVFDNLGNTALGCGNQVPSLWLLVLLVRSVRDGSHRLWCGIVGLLDYWGFLPENFRP